MYRKFFQFVLPSMLAFVFSSLYAIVDGFFVGRSCGDSGLAAISIAFPLTALIQAVGTGIGMGGAVHISIERGKGNEPQAVRFLGNTLTLLLLASVLLMAGLFLAHRPLLILMGAEGNILESACSYTQIIVLGAVFQLFSTGCTPLLRNYEASLLAMAAMVAGFLTNIVLDFLFVSVLSGGVVGAAWATVIGQAVTTIPCLFFLFHKKRRPSKGSYRLKKEITGQIVKTGVSPFGLTISPNLVAMLMNKSAMVHGGEVAVAAYAVIAYVHCIIQYLLQGIGDGAQPLISFYFGEGESVKAGKIRNLAYLFSLLTAAVYLVCILFLRYFIPDFFGASQQAAGMIVDALPIFASGAFFIAFCRVTTSYFYSIHKNVFAYFLVYGEPVLLALMLLFVFPLMFGLQGVWISVPITQGCLSIIGLILLFKGRRAASI